MVTKKTMGSTEHKETLKTWPLMSDELSGTGFANSQADYENVLRVCCRDGWGVPASVGVVQDAASGGVPSALSKCATILMAMLSIVFLAGCRYEAVDANADVVDYIIRGDARGAAKCCSFPLDLNRVSPLISIDNEKDFIRLFPIVFDKATRLEIAEKKKGAENNGWDFHNWQGESFVGGLLWRGYYGDDHRLSCINIFSESLFDLWKKEYKKDLATLASKYRTGCTWVAYYFVSEDGEYFGRVDSTGHPWKRDDRGACTKVSDRYRVLLFKRGQRTDDEPWKVFNYDGNRKGEDDKGWAFAYAIHSATEDFKFDYFHVRNEEMAEMYLEFGEKTGSGTVLRLERSSWPPPNARQRVAP